MVVKKKDDFSKISEFNENDLWCEFAFNVIYTIRSKLIFESNDTKRNNGSANTEPVNYDKLPDNVWKRSKTRRG